MDSGEATYGKPSRIKTSPSRVRKSFMATVYQKAACGATGHKDVDIGP